MLIEISFNHGLDIFCIITLSWIFYVIIALTYVFMSKTKIVNWKENTSLRWLWNRQCRFLFPSLDHGFFGKKVAKYNTIALIKQILAFSLNIVRFSKPWSDANSNCSVFFKRVNIWKYMRCGQSGEATKVGTGQN